VAVWRRFHDGGLPWRPVWGTFYRPAAGVLAIDAVTADLTGDGSDDVLLAASVGGSGACQTISVVDMASGRRTYTRQLCDARIDPSASPPGIVLTEAVFAPGDAHCCPSATRTTLLTYQGGVWIASSSSTAPA
jgi:hypothetical protein